MMLRREKPLAVFSEPGVDYAPMRRYLRMFDRHVEAGEFVKREHFEPSHVEQIDLHRNTLLILYALPDEAWRLDAMVKLRAKLSAWTVADEREEGALLGYTEEESDLWIASRHGEK